MAEVKPWEVEGNPWNTEAKFIAYIRGVLRKGWSRFPLKINYKNSVRYQIPNTNSRSMKRFPLSWVIDCEICGKPFQQNSVEVDHIGDSGTFRTIEDIEVYARHLFMLTPDKMRCLCKPCHKIVSHSQRTGTSFDEAALLKEVIAICKNPVADVTDFCYSWGYWDCSNAAKRKANVEEILRSA